MPWPQSHTMASTITAEDLIHNQAGGAGLSGPPHPFRLTRYSYQRLTPQKLISSPAHPVTSVRSNFSSGSSPAPCHQRRFFGPVFEAIIIIIIAFRGDLLSDVSLRGARPLVIDWRLSAVYDHCFSQRVEGQCTCGCEGVVSMILIIFLFYIYRISYFVNS